MCPATGRGYPLPGPAEPDQPSPELIGCDPATRSSRWPSTPSRPHMRRTGNSAWLAFTNPNAAAGSIRILLGEPGLCFCQNALSPHEGSDTPDAAGAALPARRSLNLNPRRPPRGVVRGRPGWFRGFLGVWCVWFRWVRSCWRLVGVVSRYGCGGCVGPGSELGQRPEVSEGVDAGPGPS